MSRDVRELAAELEVLEQYDALRQSAGHDYGCGQRTAELRRRRRELEAALELDSVAGIPVTLRPLPPTNAELAAAWHRVGRPRLERARRQPAGDGTPATLRTWARMDARAAVWARHSEREGAAA